MHKFVRYLHYMERAPHKSGSSILHSGCIMRPLQYSPSNHREEYIMRLSFRPFRVSALAVCLSLIGVAFAQQPRGITPEAYYSFEFLSDPHISPDGKLVAYVVTRIDRAQNRRNSAIWLSAIDGSRAPWQFTTSPQSSNSPRWSPDGKWLAFLSSRAES